MRNRCLLPIPSSYIYTVPVAGWGESVELID